MPSIEIELALVVCQVNCTWSPAEITVGVAVSSAVGAGAVADGAVSSAGGKGGFFLHPETAAKATSRRAIRKMFFCVFKGILLLRKGQVSLPGLRDFVSPRVFPPDFSTLHSAGLQHP